LIPTKKKPRRLREKSRCRFCREGIPIDYKDVPALQKLTTSQGKLFSRKRSGNCARCQRLARTAIKRARFLGLMPYVGE
jgi:small subunit ribosomal protein S18